MKIKRCIALIIVVFSLMGGNCLSSQGQAIKSTKPISSAFPSINKMEASNGFQLTSLLEAAIFNGTYDTDLGADEPVIVDMSIKNISKTDLSFPILDVESLFQVTVTDKSGNELPLTRYGRQLHQNRRRSMSVGRIGLAPNQQQTFRILVSRQYDMTLYGNYIISVSWEIPKGMNENPVRLISNPIQLAVGDFNWKNDDRQHKDVPRNDATHLPSSR